ncbi:hypothetical protein POM88_001610 [Heracleum sosnowskyi]|uniref:Uncharacterized protein n=1 Tax=Heracleum sosnowskyi TaxID=360622 RepID=A0AAD8JCI6_9APIA|nr:hypothetical protein POM88_001610 [Heracleum sosnowskyi]
MANHQIDHHESRIYLKSITGSESRPGNVGADMGVHFICGGLAGITAASATYPLDLIRTRLSAQLTFHSLNLSRSAYRSISLKPDLFDAYTISGGAKIQCSVLFKAICSVLRTAVASVDHLRVHLPSPVA